MILKAFLMALRDVAICCVITYLLIYAVNRVYPGFCGTAAIVAK